ncbi:MAG TPA: carboxypeptidase regulatory-like domain-containing protein [Acidobacteriaceae bacterium]|nr:carboxypeptidase regulatory-like domain-containing protein [Acidobacteriaceae bacterium]
MRANRKAVSLFGGLTFTIIACCCFLLPSRAAFAQVDEGSITGTVTDTSGAVVPNAQVTLLNTDQGITVQTTTGPSGSYTFSPVRAGHYTITVTAQGFAKTTQTDLTLNVAQVLQANIQLKVGSASETVRVTEAPPLLQTQEASTGQVIGSEEVPNLPLNGRNFTFLAQLGAGMQSPQADTRGNASTGAFSANGERPAQNNYLLDGIDNNSNNVDFLNGTNYVILPPVDAIQEFKVQTGDYSAELGRAAGAVLNATVKSGTNSLHGDVFEFFRNDKLDAADWFENNTAHPVKGEYRFNQFGGTIGGPIIRNKLFFFGDYQGTRRVQGTSANPLVPTVNERKSNYTNLQDILTQQAGAARTDILGRSIQRGTILDPGTTRFVAGGAIDPVSGLQNKGGDGYVRDPFSTVCKPSTSSFTLAACPDLNVLPAGRIDQKAVALLNLFPQPNTGLATYQTSPALYEHSNEFDTREDFNPNQGNQVFARFSYSDDPIFIPGPFKGIADGGAFQQGNQTAKSAQMVAAYTHVFSPSVVNQARAGFAHLHTTRFGPEGSVMGIPAQYGILGIPQVSENGGLPAISITNLQTLGSNQFLPSDEATATLQLTDDFTRIYGKHSFKMGIEFQNAKFSTLQPATSHGLFSYSGTYTDIPNQTVATGGLAQFLLPPTAAPATINGNPNPNGYSYSGGSNSVSSSNINKTYDEKKYFAAYFQDDWKMTPKLTLNVGVRYDYFGPINETNGGQANFIPTPLPALGIGAPTFLLPASGKDNRTLSVGHPIDPTNPKSPNTPGSTCAGTGCWGLVDLLAADGITLDVTNRYGQGLLKVQKADFAPRLGMEYQFTPKLVGRGGFGLFYNSFENQGYGPNIGENYPFVFNLNYGVTADPSDPHSSIVGQVAPVSYNSAFQGCPTAGPGGTASVESGFSCIPFNPAVVNAKSLGLQGLQFNYQTPRTYAANLTFEYSITRSMALTASYVYTHDADLQHGVGYKNVTQILPAGIGTGSGCPYGNFAVGTTPGKLSCVPFPDFGGGSYQATDGVSSYHGLQTKLQQQVSHGLLFLLTYTWSKAMSDAGDLLNGTGADTLRAYAVPGLGPMFDYSLADFDIRNVVHFSGMYDLPFGKGRQFMNTGGIANQVLGGWSTDWIVTLQGGQPLGFGCPTGSTSGTGCNDVVLPGKSPQPGVHVKTSGGIHAPFWFGNPSAFTQPCKMGGAPGALAPIPGSALNCVPLSGAAALGDKRDQTTGPGIHNLDFALHKSFPFTERYSLEFRSEFFNILNHPNFNQPNFGGNGVVAQPGSGDYTTPTFGAIGSTRTPPRQIQFAVKMYY